MKGNAPMPTRTRSGEAGQIIVIFALGLIAMVAMVGLVLDGGSTFAQKRDQQNATDLAAMAAANEFLLSGDKVAAEIRGRETAEANGFKQDVASGVTVAIYWPPIENDTEVVVDIAAPHHNNFVSVMGFTTWDVSTTATVEVGIPDNAAGGPFIFNSGIFSDPGGIPLPQYSNPNAPYTFGDGNGDVPNAPGDIAWTCYGTCANVDSATVRAMVDGTSPVDVTLNPTVDFNQYIGQHNSGNHSTLFGEVSALLIGQKLSVPIVDDFGFFQGWATFLVTGANQAAKTITGYFVSPFNQSDNLEVVGCSASCPKPRYFGTYVLRLVD
jgi:Flp pilus assembly protein TadG